MNKAQEKLGKHYKQTSLNEKEILIRFVKVIKPLERQLILLGLMKVLPEILCAPTKEMELLLITLAVATISSKSLIMFANRLRLQLSIIQTQR